jgi:hypothetical protein
MMMSRTLFEWHGWMGLIRRDRSCPRHAGGNSSLVGSFTCVLELAVLSLLTALAPHASAQRSSHAAIPARPAIQRSNSPAPSFASGRDSNSSSRFRRTHSRVPFDFPFLGDGLSLDDLYSSGYPVSSQPPPELMQFAPDMSGPGNFMGRPASDHESQGNQPLMIELQGDKYVRVTAAAADGEGLPLNFAPGKNSSAADRLGNAPSRSASTHSVPSIAPRIASPSAAADAPPQESLPPAVLIFRDGRSEEVRDYTIADGVLYARGDFYTDGYWNKKIDLAELNVSETLQANADRNVKFVLPSSPNEVITRP